jgi:hypothetical protein
MDGKKNDTMKHNRFILLFLSLSLVAHAEHLFEAGVRAGMAGYDARCNYVLSVTNLHAGGQFSYAYHSPYVIGFRAAATLDCSRAGFRREGYDDTYSVIDVENAPMQVDYSIGYLQEMYSTWSMGVPVQLAFSGNNVSFYIGPKIVFPFYVRRSELAENAALSVYYPLQDNRVYNSFPLAASPLFQEFQEGESSIFPKVQYGLAAELCYDVLVYTGRRSRSYLSVGVYFDYSFSSIQDEPSDRISLLMLSDTRDGFPLHHILTPVVAAQRQGKRLVAERKPFDVGIKVSYRIAPYKPHQEVYKTCHCYGIKY